jgi:exodeoxyribonuclease V alpha subunit
MPKTDSFEEKYPHLNRFVEERGWIEIGQSEDIDSFARAYDYGGTVYEGKGSYPSMEAAFQDLEKHIKAYFEDL